jgi:hypothetical protein
MRHCYCGLGEVMGSEGFTIFGRGKDPERAFINAMNRYELHLSHKGLKAVDVPKAEIEKLIKLYCKKACDMTDEEAAENARGMKAMGMQLSLPARDVWALVQAYENWAYKHLYDPVVNDPLGAAGYVLIREDFYMFFGWGPSR